MCTRWGARSFSASTLPVSPKGWTPETVAQIFAGGAVKVREAGAAIAGGHTDQEPRTLLWAECDGPGSPRPDHAQGRRAAGRSALSHQTAGHGHHHDRGQADRQRRERCTTALAPPRAGQTRPGPKPPGRSHRLHAAAESGRSPGGRFWPGCRARPTSPALGCWAMAAKWPRLRPKRMAPAS